MLVWFSKLAIIENGPAQIKQSWGNTWITCVLASLVTLVFVQISDSEYIIVEKKGGAVVSVSFLSRRKSSSYRESFVAIRATFVSVLIIIRPAPCVEKPIDITSLVGVIYLDQHDLLK